MLSNKFFELYELGRTKSEEFRNSVRYKQYDFHYETQGDVSMRALTLAEFLRAGLAGAERELAQDYLGDLWVFHP